jgi:malonate transporter
MSHFVNALIPVLALIALGYGLKRLEFLSAAVWAGIEKITYYLMFPALLINTLASQDLAGQPWARLFLISTLVLLISALSLWLYFALTKRTSAATFTSIFQGGVRFNTYIALSVSGAYFGKEGLALISVALGSMIVVANILCVGVFVLYGKAEARTLKTFAKQLVLNPLVIGCAIGWVLSLSGVGLPWVSSEIFEIIGRAALPLGLLAVGAALRPGLIRGHAPAILEASVAQFLIKPAVTLALCAAFGLTGVAAGVLLIVFITPTASSAYILARQLGGDLEAMASIITLQTLVAFAVMPIWAWVWLTAV